MNSRIVNIILPLVGGVIYVCLDFLYIYLTRNHYEQAVQNIQKEEMEVDVVAAIVCYAIMGLGWYLIAIQLASAYFDKLKQRRPSWSPLSSSALSGLVSGFLYGFVVYGVFNCTTRALFSNRYPVTLLVQDMAWGSLYTMLYTTVYMLIWHQLSHPVDL
ncbi:unnamed protein product [Rotaria sordida]|uniref:Uncharacterized protein n=1 Tax=Rotaria sordida TaxID=392033 RepID=A0A813SRI6_9BILA|nr:unnamed protein product [Rotaria sordida]CAF0808122.1 unnamed protein product [Rotaria sordida]CAF0820275.1 unnamed protein product [Rotaria sordida]CAF0826148.1 unnamed protein product [Rotaria sordida]CAF0827454.1 unnamed protein product [Rotaria sordida]